MENQDNRLKLSDDEDNFYINITIALFIRYENLFPIEDFTNLPHHGLKDISFS